MRRSQMSAIDIRIPRQLIDLYPEKRAEARVAYPFFRDNIEVGSRLRISCSYTVSRWSRHYPVTEAYDVVVTDVRRYRDIREMSSSESPRKILYEGATREQVFSEYDYFLLRRDADAVRRYGVIVFEFRYIADY
jgi:ASC-1-like (ASCH) protein